MGQWENEMRNALDQYSGNISNNYSGLSNRALGALANAAWARQAEIEAERKRQLEVQKQKDADAALERKLKLQEMQFKMDALNEAREQAKNNQTLLTTLAPYQPRQGFDSETGENIISGYSPLSPAFDALGSASGFAGSGYSKVLNDTAKAVAAESQDPERFAQMTDKERQKAIDNVLSPYEVSYELRNKPIDIYKKEKDYENRELIRDMINQQQTYNTDARVAMNEKTNNTKITNNQNTNETKRSISDKNNEIKIILQGIKEGSIKPIFVDGKLAGHERVSGFKPSLTPAQRKEHEFYERKWLKRFEELEFANENLDFDKLVELTTSQMGTIMKQLDKNKLKLFGEVTKREARNLKSFDDNIKNDDNPENIFEEILNDYNNLSLENPKGIQQILYSESGLK